MNLTVQTLNLLIFFFPGLIASAMLNVARPRGSTEGVQRLIEAILFTLTIAALAPLLLNLAGIESMLQPLELEAEQLKVRPGGWPTFMLSTVLAVLLPLPVAAILSRDRHMRLLRWLKISDRTSRESTWSQVFAEQGNTFVVVHLKDGRRLQGHPMYYSDDQNEGALYLGRPAWILDDIGHSSGDDATDSDTPNDGEVDNQFGEGAPRVIETNQRGVLIYRTEIQFIEFQTPASD